MSIVIEIFGAEVECDFDYTYYRGEDPCYTPGLCATPGCDEEFDVEAVWLKDSKGGKVNLFDIPELDHDALYDEVVRCIKEGV